MAVSSAVNTGTAASDHRFAFGAWVAKVARIDDLPLNVVRIPQR